MPLADFLAGAALFAVMLAAIALATAFVVRRRLRHLDALARTLAGVVIGSAILIGVHLVPLALGALTRATVLVAAALALVGVATLVKPAAREPDRPPNEDQPAPPPSGPAAWALAALACAFAAVAALADLGRWAGDELVGVDPLTFHLPNVGRWIQLHSLWQIDQFVPLLAHGNYPNNGDVVLLSTVLPWHNDFLVRLPITFFLATTAVAVYAVARELRAPRAASALAAAAIVSLPVVGIATIPRALPDTLMWTTFACGLLFLLRHARTGRRSDLVLAGVALAIACGTKWYGVSSVAIVVAVWIAARLLAARRGPAAVPIDTGTATAAGAAAGAGAGGGGGGGGGAGAAVGAVTGRASQHMLIGAALRDGVLVGGLAILGTLVWLVRNLVLSGNPVFPLHVAPFGVEIFSAPPDVIRDQAGFTIADYAGDPSVLWQLAGEIVEGLGSAPIVCGLALAVAVVVARRGARTPPALGGARAPDHGVPAWPSDPRVLALVAGAIALALVYTVTPATALGLRGDPSLAHANTRYAIPALLLAVPVAAWLAGRLPRAGSLTLQVALAAGALAGAYKGYEVHGARDVVLAGATLAALAAASTVLWHLRDRRVVVAAAAVLAAFAGLAAAHRMEDRINDGRYRGIDRGIDAMLRVAPSGRHIGLASDWSVGGLPPIWPAFGTRIGNDVEYVGEFVDGFLTPYRDEASFQAALRRGGYDVLVVGRGFYPPENTPEQRWAIAAGWRTVGLSTRLRVLVPPT